jgi:hypothetical protein
MRKDGGDGPSFAAGKLGSPRSRVEVLEQNLVHAVVDRECLLHALLQIRSARGSRSRHTISSWEG